MQPDQRRSLIWVASAAVLLFAYAGTANAADAECDPGWRDALEAAAQKGIDQQSTIADKTILKPDTTDIWSCLQNVLSGWDWWARMPNGDIFDVLNKEACKAVQSATNKATSTIPRGADFSLDVGGYNLGKAGATGAGTGSSVQVPMPGNGATRSSGDWRNNIGNIFSR